MPLTTHVTRDGTRVTFSDTACMQTSNGDLWSAFTRNSYIARVVLTDGRTIYVALPEGAASEQRYPYADEVIKAALAKPDLPDGGKVFL